MHLFQCFLLLHLLFLSNLLANKNNFNPYEVLGLSPTASEKEIRQAYKKLAKHWHPDKNSEPNAHDQFTKINAAYEILSDSTKKSNYDEYGTTSQDNHRGFNTNHFRDPYDIFRAHFGGDFHFFHESPSGAKKIIHTREFLSDILPNSDRKPYVLYGSTNFCLHCRQSASIFRGLEKQFNEVGIGTAEFNINDRRLSGELGIASSPALCVISQRKVYHFNDHGKSEMYSEMLIKEFVRKTIPIQRYVRTLQTVDDILTMIASYNRTNRVHALLITKQKTPTLKFVIPCLQYFTRIQCALLNSTVISGQLPSFLNQLSTTSDTILFFKEDTLPTAIIKDNDLTFVNIHKFFESNQLLHLPTITSSNVFNFVCQTNSAKPCFLLIGDANLFEQRRLALVPIAQQFFQQYGSRMAFLDPSPTKQIAFSKILSSYYRTDDRKLIILVARRWFDDTIEIVNTNVEFDENSLNELKRSNVKLMADIEANLKLFMMGRWQNAKKYPLPTIFNIDETDENIFYSIMDIFNDKWNYWVERNPIVRSLSSYLFTYQFLICIILLILYIWHSKQDPVVLTNTSSKQTRKSYSTPSSRNNISRETSNIVRTNEFDASLLQHYTSPGASNVIILLLVADTPTDPCVAHFLRQISTIKDSRMIFTILYRERSSEWLNALNANIEDEEYRRLIHFSSSNVLALYIRRKFFVPYWSQHTDVGDDDEPLDETGGFLGMDHHRSSSTSSSIDSRCSSTNGSLSFNDWIELLFDGNIRTPITVKEWPMTFS